MTPASEAPALLQSFELSDGEFRDIAALVYAKSGIVLANHKKDMVYSRLTRRLRALKLSSFADYISHVQSAAGADETGHLVNAITTNLTRFFREEHHFEHLRDKVLMPLLTANGGEPKRLRIWSAGCSKGAEAYSIAMVLTGCLDKHQGWDAKILATDIDTDMLAQAQSGLYEASDLSLIPAPYQRYVKQTPSCLHMSSAIQNLITFKRLNLLEDWPMRGAFDVIFCRNVVIYFDKDTQRGLFKRFRHVIKPEGRLYIGHSENLAQVSADFKLEGRTIYCPI